MQKNYLDAGLAHILGFPTKKALAVYVEKHGKDLKEFQSEGKFATWVRKTREKEIVERALKKERKAQAERDQEERQLNVNLMKPKNPTKKQNTYTAYILLYARDHDIKTKQDIKKGNRHQYITDDRGNFYVK